MATDKVRSANACDGLTVNGNLCRAKAILDSNFCHLHQPKERAPAKSQQKRIAAQKKATELIDTSSGEVVTQEDVDQTIAVAAGQALGSDPAFAKYELAKRVSHTLACSSLVPEVYRGKPNDVFVAINMGSELGMDPFQAIQSIAVIEGKPCLYGDGLIGVVRASPKCMWIEESLSEDGVVATCKTQRKGDPNPITASYSMTDAMQAGIDSKFNWKKHPKRMLQMRARSYCLRDAYPDLLKGLGVVEEHQDHEDTPPPVTTYELPKPASNVAEPAALETTITLSDVERAMHQSDSMEELLKAGDMAKSLSEMDQGTARVTYKKMRRLLQEPQS